MDRPVKLARIVAGCGLALSLVVAGGSGCRSTKSDVPPHRPFLSGVEGNQAPAFNSLTNPSGPTDGLPAVSAGGSQYGTPTNANARPLGLPTNNSYGPPGTSSLGTLPGGDATRPSMGSAGVPMTANSPLTGIPQAGTGPLAPGSNLGTGLVAPTRDLGPR